MAAAAVFTGLFVKGKGMMAEAPRLFDANMAGDGWLASTPFFFLSAREIPFRPKLGEFPGSFTR